jgi:hypothetical protein
MAVFKAVLRLFLRVFLAIIVFFDIFVKLFTYKSVTLAPGRRLCLGTRVGGSTRSWPRGGHVSAAGRNFFNTFRPIQKKKRTLLFFRHLFHSNTPNDNANQVTKNSIAMFIALLTVPPGGIRTRDISFRWRRRFLFILFFPSYTGGQSEQMGRIFCHIDNFFHFSTKKIIWVGLQFWSTFLRYINKNIWSPCRW